MQKPQFSIRYFVIMLFLMVLASSSYASECYHYHTPVSFKLQTAGEKLYLERFVKDPNKITVVSYQKVFLKMIAASGAQIYKETDNGLIIKNSIGYFYVAKSNLQEKVVVIDKLVDHKQLTYPPIGLTFFLNGAWKQLDYNPYYPTPAKRITFKVVKNFPKQAFKIAEFNIGGRSVYVLKNQTGVYTYDDRGGAVSLLPNLNPKTVKLATLDSTSDEYCIYDEKTFYVTRDSFVTTEDLSAQLKGLRIPNLAKMEMIKFKNSVYLDFKDGGLWPYVSAGISLADGGAVNFFPVKNVKYVPKAKLVLHKGMLYDDPWSLINLHNPIEFSAIKNLDQLVALADGNYRYGKQLFEVKQKENGRGLVAINNSTPAELEKISGLKYNNALWSYQKTLSGLYLGRGSLFCYNPKTQKLDMKMNHRTPIKDLGLAFAFDDKLLIENQVIVSKADFNTIAFLGSTVEVVSPCDGGRGQIPVVVNYTYFFKDKNAVYTYVSGGKAMMKLARKDAANCNQSNFIAKFWTEKNQS